MSHQWVLNRPQSHFLLRAFFRRLLQKRYLQPNLGRRYQTADSEVVKGACDRIVEVCSSPLPDLLSEASTGCILRCTSHHTCRSAMLLQKNVLGRLCQPRLEVLARILTAIEKQCVTRSTKEARVETRPHPPFSWTAEQSADGLCQLQDASIVI